MNKKITITGFIFMILISSITVSTLAASSITQDDDLIFIYNFNEGWNLITLPLYLSNNNFTSIFGLLISPGIMLNFCYGWNAKTQSYMLVSTLEPGYSYWVYLYQNISYTIFGKEIDNNLSIDIINPHNMIGWVHDYNITAEHICQSIIGCKSVSIPSGTIDDLGNIEYITHNATDVKNNFKITKGMGFWVTTNISSEWDGYVTSNLIPFANAAGPYEGYAGEDVLINGSRSIDFDGEIVSYEWSYLDPLTSSTIHMGDDEIIKYSWCNVGAYEIILKVTDDKGAVGFDNTNAVISNNIELNINIKKFSIAKIDLFIENIGTIDFSNVEWSISVKGGFSGGIDILENGSINKLEKNNNQKIGTQEKSILKKLGPVIVTVKVIIDKIEFEKYFKGFVIGRFYIDLTEF